MILRLALTAVALLIAGVHGDARAQEADKWLPIIARDIDLSTGTVTIDTTKAKGRFKAIRLEAKDEPIVITRVDVVYSNGQRHSENRRINLLGGERTRPIDMRSDERFIDAVVLFYERNTQTRSKARLEIWGLQSPSGAAAVRPAPAVSSANGKRGTQLEARGPEGAADSEGSARGAGQPRDSKIVGGPPDTKATELRSDLSSTPEFSWPPPRASGRVEIPRHLLSPFNETDTTLGRASRRLQDALLKAGYADNSFYRIGDDGIALVTRIERMAADGTPDRSRRWTPPDANEPFSLARFVRGLVWPEPGHYRLIVFTITPKTFANIGTEMTSKQAEEKFREGVAALPKSLEQLPFTADHRGFALIYEYEKEKPDATPVLLDPSRLSAMEHLQKTSIWPALQGALPARKQ